MRSAMGAAPRLTIPDDACSRFPRTVRVSCVPCVREPCVQAHSRKKGRETGIECVRGGRECVREGGGGEGGESAREREKVREKDRERESGGLGEDAEDGSVGLGIFHVEEVTEVV